MFGYVKAFAPELKVKDHTLYKAAYCGLCKAMGQCTGHVSRLTLSYDMVFLVLVRMALSGQPYTIRKERCILHPFKKRPVMQMHVELLYGAKASALLTSEKLKDDIRDTKGVKKLACLLASGVFHFSDNQQDTKELHTYMVSELDRLHTLEMQKTASVDLPAECFGNLTARVFSHGLDGDNARIAHAVGFYTGKWIYAADALDDFEKDIKTGSYNPFAAFFGNCIPEESVPMISSALVSHLCEIEKALDLISFSDISLKEIVYNIVYEGLRRKSAALTQKFMKTKGETVE